MPQPEILPSDVAKNDLCPQYAKNYKNSMGNNQWNKWVKASAKAYMNVKQVYKKVIPILIMNAYNYNPHFKSQRLKILTTLNAG